MRLSYEGAVYQAVSVALSGLAAGKEYCAALIAENASGTARSGQISFTGGVPALKTLEALPTSATAAIVEGEVDPAAQQTNYEAAYAPASSQWCTSHGSEGSPTKTRLEKLSYQGAAAEAVSVELSGLAAGKEYCAALLAENASGTARGGQLSFAAGLPSASAEEVFSTGATTATVEAYVDPASQATHYDVAYALAGSHWCTSQGTEGSPTKTTLEKLASQGAEAVSVELSGLAAGKEYCAALLAENASGTARGGQLYFAVGVPSAFTEYASPTGPATASVEGYFLPAGQETHYEAAYAPASSQWCASQGSEGSPTKTRLEKLSYEGAGAEAVSVELNGLAAGKEYCAALLAENASGTAQGGQLYFAVGPPSAFTEDAFPTGATRATVEGYVDPAGQATQYDVAYALTSSQWCTSEGAEGSPTKTTLVKLSYEDANYHEVSVELSGLAAGKEYCAELLAENASGTAQGAGVRFAAGIPSAFTEYASPTGATTATVEGYVDPAGQATQYDVAYALASSQWCTSDGVEGSPTKTTLVKLSYEGAAYHEASVELSGLRAGEEYCAELLAENASGSAQGGQLAFTTEVARAPTVTEISPSKGTTAGGTRVTIKGEHLGGASKVEFAGTPASGLEALSETEVKATSPAHAAGEVDVTLTTVGGTSATSASDRFTYEAPVTTTTTGTTTGTTGNGTTGTGTTGTTGTGTTGTGTTGTGTTGTGTTITTGTGTGTTGTGTATTGTLSTPSLGIAVADATASVRGAAAAITLRCDGGDTCRGTVRLIARRRIVIGEASFLFNSGARYALDVHLSAKGRALLGEAGKTGLEVMLAGRGVKPRRLRLTTRKSKHSRHT